MAISKSTTLSVVCFAAVGAVLCVLYHTTAIYSYGPAVGDLQYGWPFRYGFDQDDVTGEFLWNLASFDVLAFLADIIIGVAAGAFLAWIAGTMRLRWGAKVTPHDSSRERRSFARCSVLNHQAAPHVMNSEGKASMIALVLLATNWHWSKTIQGPNTTSSVHADGPTVTFLLCSIALVILLLGLYRLLRALLDDPVRIPSAVQLASWRPVLLLVPLLFTSSGSYTTTTADTTTIVSLGYGCEASTPLFIVSAAMLLVFQSVSELLRIYKDSHAHSR